MKYSIVWYSTVHLRVLVYNFDSDINSHASGIKSARVEKVPRVPGFKGSKGNKESWVKRSS